MIELTTNALLVFGFPELHEDAHCSINFQRTLRIPDDSREYPLPPGLGAFPMEHVEDHTARLPASWSEHQGVLLPMYQAEALWINFNCRSGYPFAIKIAAGKINAVTGDPWTNPLTKKPQDYVVAPDQPWLDGFCVQKGLIRQFVAMPLGDGYTAEEQLTGSAEHGGLQIIVYPMKRERYEKLCEERERTTVNDLDMCFSIAEPDCEGSMGLAPGGLMRQEIYDDQYGFDAWDLSRSSRCFVHILNSTQWTAATGKDAPGQPPSAADYTEAGLPWFAYYNDNAKVLNGAAALAGLASVAAKAVELGEAPLPGGEAIAEPTVVKLGPTSEDVVDGKW